MAEAGRQLGGSDYAHAQRIQRALLYGIRRALSYRTHVDDRLGDKFHERVMSSNQYQIGQGAFISNNHCFDRIGAEASGGRQTMNGDDIIRF